MVFPANQRGCECADKEWSRYPSDVDCKDFLQQAPKLHLNFRKKQLPHMSVRGMRPAQFP